MIPEPGPDSRRVSFFDEQATHRARARRWGAVSALIILGLGGVSGFLMLGVLSFYALLLAGLLPTWLTAPLAAAGLKDNLPPAWFLFTAGVMLAASVAAAVRRVLGTAFLGAIESTVGLRPVNPADLEERQLANIVSEDSAVEAHHVAARLTLSLQPEGMNDMLAFMERMLNLPLPLGAFNKVVGSLILMLFMPLILSRLAGFLIYSMLTLFVLGPFIAFAIRARRRLADATALQLQLCSSFASRS